MISRVKKYINHIISLQDIDSWICPCKKEERKNYDSRPISPICKVLTVYIHCSKDYRIPKVIYLALKNLYNLLISGNMNLFDLGKYRWFEGYVSIEFLLEFYDKKWIFDLAKILKEQGVDYKNIIDLWVDPKNEWRLDTHIVNICMALKAQAYTSSILNIKNDNETKLLNMLKME